MLQERNNWIFFKHEKDLLYNVLLINSYPLPTVIAFNVNANKLTVKKVLLFIMCECVYKPLKAVIYNVLPELTWSIVGEQRI